MKNFKLFSLILVSCVFSLHAQTLQENAWVTNGSILTMVKSGNTTYIGGNFKMVGPYTGAAALIGAADSHNDLSFPKVEGAVIAVVGDGNGGWYIGGQFTMVGGQPISNLAHIRSDNIVDLSFRPNPNQIVYALAFSGKLLYAGGDFTSIGGQNRNFIAAVDQTGQATAWDANANASVNAISVAGNFIYVGGDFTSIGGQNRNFIAAVDQTGQATAWNPGANRWVQAITIHNNTVYIGGNFTSVGGKARKYIAAIDENGLVTAWNPGANKAVGALAVSEDIIYAGGAFTNIGMQSRSYLAAINVNGEVTTWNPMADNAVNSLFVAGDLVYVAGKFLSIGGLPRYNAAAVKLNGQISSWAPVINSDVNTIAASGNNVFVGGFFTSVGGQLRNYIAALDENGVATAWDANADGPVKALAVLNNIVYAGGTFNTIGGQARSNIAALDENGQALAWNPNATGGLLKSINALAVSGSTIYVGGTFTSIGGQNRNNIAALDQTGQALAWNPNAGGTLLKSVNALAVSGDAIYVGGNFSSIGGKPRNNIAALDLNGKATDWNPNAGGILLSTVNSLAIAEKIVFAGGFFTSIGGQKRNYIAAIDQNGLATDWNPNASGTLIKDVKTIVPVGNMILVGGNFTQIGGQNRNYIAAIDENGKATSWNPNANSPVNTMLVSNNQVYAGGEFVTICNNVRSYFAQISLPEGIKFKIWASSGENGAISPSGLAIVNYGSTQSFEILPNVGYHVADVIVDGQSIGATKSYTFNNVTENHSISATFAIDEFTITSSCSEHGQITPAGKTIITYGRSQIYTITPDTGYHIINVLVDDVSQGAVSSYTFNSISANHTISAVFAIDVFAINAASGGNGTIFPNGVTNVNYGGSQSFSIIPIPGYHIADVIVDGHSVGAQDTFIFKQVNCAHNISAVFTIGSFSITASAGDHGTITPSGILNIKYGASQKYVIKPDFGYYIYDIKVDGESKGPSDVYSFIEVKGNHTISASFIQEKPAAPVLLTSANNAVGLPVKFTLTWKSSAFAESYRLQVALDEYFTNLIIDDSTLTSTYGQVSGLNNSTKYFWRVSAKNSTGSSSFSEMWNFTTVTAQPEGSELLSPADNSINQPTSIVLSWKKNQRADLYLLQVSSDSTFSENLRALIVKPDSMQEIVSQKVSGLANNQKYYWKVSAENIGGVGPLSETWTFSTVMPGPGIPLLAIPGNNAKDIQKTPQISWVKAKYAESYILIIAEDNQFNKIVFSDSTITDTLKDIRNLKQGARYFWKVIAKNIAGENHSPDIWNFITELNPPDSLIVNVISKSKIKLTWKDRSNNTGGFIIERKHNEDFIMIDSLKAGTTSFIDSSVSVSMSYQYRVKAFTSEAVSTYSTIGGATVTGVSMPGTLPKEYALMQNYPNPFNPVTTIRYGLPVESNVKIEVYNMIGEKVAELYNNIQKAGYYELYFDADNYSSGIYFCLINAHAADGSIQFRNVKKMILLK